MTPQHMGAGCRRLRYVPHPNGFISTSTIESTSTWRAEKGCYVVGMALENVLLFPAIRVCFLVPHANGLVRGRAEDSASMGSQAIHNRIVTFENHWLRGPE